MGANCCVSSRNKPFPDDTRFDASTYRNVRYSPSWSFRWDNRTHIEDIVDNPARFSHHDSGNVSEIRSGADAETEHLSNGGSPYATSQKSPIKTRTTRSSEDATADQSTGSSSSSEVSLNKVTIKSQGIASASETKSSMYIPSVPSSSGFNLDSSSRSHSLPFDTHPSRKALRSPAGYQLSRQASDSRIPSLKSLHENNSPEARQSFVHSACSHDLSTAGESQGGGSSDGWSMRTFTELIASSQRERWSFDSENSCSIKSKITRSMTKPLPSLSPDLQTCGLCSKLLKERDPWSTHKIVYINELAVVAVLVCGHVYHAECLDGVTAETDRCEPPCPVCTNGERSASKPLRKTEVKSRSKISRIAVAAVDGDFDPVFSVAGKQGPRMGASSSMKSSFSRPFLRRHFSIGPRPSHSASEKETTRKKGFWARYRGD